MLETVQRERRNALRLALMEQRKAKALQSAFVNWRIANWIARFEKAKESK